MTANSKTEADKQNTRGSFTEYTIIVRMFGLFLLDLIKSLLMRPRGDLKYDIVSAKFPEKLFNSNVGSELIGKLMDKIELSPYYNFIRLVKIRQSDGKIEIVFKNKFSYYFTKVKMPSLASDGDHLQLIPSNTVHKKVYKFFANYYEDRGKLIRLLDKSNAGLEPQKCIITDVKTIGDDLKRLYFIEVNFECYRFIERANRKLMLEGEEVQMRVVDYHQEALPQVQEV